MAEIREGSISDLDVLTALGSRLVVEKLGLRQDREKIARLIQTAVSSKAHKLLIADESGQMVGAMLTVSDTFMYAEKMYAHIVCIYGESVEITQQLLDTTMEWVDGRKGIQLVSYSVPIKTSVDELLLKNNFKDTGSMIVWRRYEFSK